MKTINFVIFCIMFAGGFFAVRWYFDLPEVKPGEVWESTIEDNPFIDPQQYTVLEVKDGWIKHAFGNTNVDKGWIITSFDPIRKFARFKRKAKEAPPAPGCRWCGTVLITNLMNVTNYVTFTNRIIVMETATNHLPTWAIIDRGLIEDMARYHIREKLGTNEAALRLLSDVRSVAGVIRAEAEPYSLEVWKAKAYSWEEIDAGVKTALEEFRRFDFASNFVQFQFTHTNLILKPWIYTSNEPPRRPYMFRDGGWRVIQP